MADEKFDVVQVTVKMRTIDDLFAAFADTLDKINAFVESNVNASLASSAYGDLGAKLLNIWNYNSATFGDFHENFDNWSKVVAIITANNSKFAVDAQATYRDNVGTLDGVKEARDFISKSNGLANVSTTDGFNSLSSDARSVLDSAYRAITEKTKKNNTYGGKTITYTDAAGNKIEMYYDEEGNYVGKKITSKSGKTTCYDRNNNTIDKMPSSSEYEDQKKKRLEELEELNSYYKNHLDDLKYGTYEKKVFTASNGTKIEYYVYIPDYGREVTGLPVHVYLHGSGETGSGINNQSLPKLINNQSVTPEGIVISVQAKTQKDYFNGNYEDAIVELAETISKENNGDSNKISLSGHSMGAIAGYRVIARHPDTFSAFVPVSGVPSNLDTLADSGTKVWFFHGSNDSNCDYNLSVSAYNKLKNAGADVDFYVFKGKGHGIQNQTYSEEYTNSAGETINPLTWAFDQTRETIKT